MLLPKRVKHRKQHRGRMTGRAMRGNKIAHGEYGLIALEPCMDHQSSNRSSSYRNDTLY